MGKKRTTVVSDETKTKKKKSIFRWEEAYSDLPEGTATVLREARVKPEQLAAMADGEILALAGMNPQFLETIRAQYPAALQEMETIATPAAVAPTPPVETPKSTSASSFSRRPRQRFGRSKRYKNAKTQVETKSYTPEVAAELLKQVAYGKHKTVELHLNVREPGIRGELSLPYSVGKEIRVAIFSPDLAEKIKAGKIEFDILLARPSDMPQVAPLAKVLGPRGIMPNPKNGTVTDKPEERAKQLSAGATLAYRTEPKAPVIHLVVGSLDQKNAELAENVAAVMAGIGAARIVSAYLKSTMSPAIRVSVA